MTVQTLEYPLVDGYIHSWLVAGPLAFPLDDGQFQGKPKTEIARQFYLPDSMVSTTPVDRDPLQIEETSLAWRYFRCQDDHLVDVSAVYPRPQYLRAWAYARLDVPEPGKASFLLTSSGPVDCWLNGVLLYHGEDFPSGLQTVPIEADLGRENELVIRFAQVSQGRARQQMALKLAALSGAEPGEQVKVRLFTHARFPHRQIAFERLFEKAYLEEVVNYRGAHINLRWAEDASEELRYAYQIQDDRERIYVEGTWDVNPKEPLDVGHTYHLFERPYWVALRAPGREYYDQNMRYQRRLPIHVLDTAYSDRPYGSIARRRREALENAAKRENHLFAEIAKMALDHWQKVEPGVILASIDRVRQEETGSEILLTGLLGMFCRYRDRSEFPASVIEPFETCLLASRLGIAAPGDPGPDAPESRAILQHTCEILAGQLYPERAFARSGMTGAQHCRHGEELALEWLRSRGQRGFADWDSNAFFDQHILALSHLASLAENQVVRELAAVLLDKLLFLMAINSLRGAYGSTHGRTLAPMVKSAQLEATSGVMRMLWGVGVFNHHCLGTVSLACSDYEFPSFLSQIATKPAEELWSKERHVFAGGEVNKVTYRTPDALLSSAQDYRPGEKGSQEHIWQATLGPDAVVFVNHPACMSDSEAHLPGFWLGNATLPRVAQWKDVLVAIHRLPEEDWMGFTHAFFPTYAFDEVDYEGGWAFARKGKGYLAITARQGMELIKRGPDGYRELRSYGRENIWLCHLGRDAVDGYFSTFKRDILKIRPAWEGLSVRFTSLRQEEIAFGWEGPLRVNQTEQPLSGFKHVENPYCTAELPAKSMDITDGDIVMRLNFE